MERKNRVAVIGAGPAGVSASLFLQRYAVPFVLFEKNEIGGLIRHANRVENFPFIRPSRGPAVAALLGNILEKKGIRPEKTEVLSVEKKGRGFVVETAGGRRFFDFVIAASGTRPLMPPEIAGCPEERIAAENVPELLLKARNRKIIIIGSGDAAFDYALGFSRKNDVVILNRSRKRKCLEKLFSRALSRPRITYLENSRVKDLCFSGGKIIALCSVDGRRAEMEADYLLPAVGRSPELSYLKKKGGNPGVNFMTAGDASAGIYRQMALAWADGMKCAMKICYIIRAGKIPR